MMTTRVCREVFGFVKRYLAPNAVIQMHNAIRERMSRNQIERDISMARSDERNPFADHYGNNVDREFINRACIQERRDDLSAAHHPYVLASHRAQFSHELRD
jgi:hypothetical protein